MAMKRLVLVAALFLACSQSAWAVRTPMHVAAESPEYGRKFGGMIGRGVLNVATCFVDLLVNIVNETRTGPPLVGTLVGVGKGAGCTTLRALSGGVDLVTFWVPGFNGFPVSDSYDNCVAVQEPEIEPEPMVMQPGSGYAVPAYVPTDQPGAAQSPAMPAAPSEPEAPPRYTK